MNETYEWWHEVMSHVTLWLNYCSPLFYKYEGVFVFGAWCTHDRCPK